jgi:hypothetical protein
MGAGRHYRYSRTDEQSSVTIVTRQCRGACKGPVNAHLTLSKYAYSMSIFKKGSKQSPECCMLPMTGMLHATYDRVQLARMARINIRAIRAH